MSIKLSKLENINIKLIAAALPLLFTFLTVFHTRESVGVFYGLALSLIVVEFFLIRKISAKSFKIAYPYILIICGAIGLAAAGVLTIEKIELLKDPNRITSCSISPIVACSPVINSSQASIFTIPNPAFGILGFGLVISVGMVLLAGATKLKAWWWRMFLAGTALGTAFCAWLIYVTLYEVGSICVYCSGAWVVTAATFIPTLKFVSEEGAIKLPLKLRALVEKYPLEIIISLYGIVIALILQRFWSYWISLI
jgi:uncharacterized membrane protein